MGRNSRTKLSCSNDCWATLSFHRIPVNRNFGPTTLVLVRVARHAAGVRAEAQAQEGVDGDGTAPVRGVQPRLIAVFLILVGCGSRDRQEYRRWYIPLNSERRIEKDAAQVAFLEGEPTDRKFIVLGIVAPPDDKFDSFGETVNAIRAAVALYGADAVFLVSEEEGEKWGFRAGGGSAGGGKGTTHKIRAKAIAWVK